MGPGNITLDLELFRLVLQPQEEPLVDRDRTAEEADKVQLRLDNAPLQLSRLLDETRQKFVERLGKLVNGSGKLLFLGLYSYWFHGFLYPASKSLKD